MKFNLLSICQLCDPRYKAIFHSTKSLVKHNELDTIILVGHRKNNMYTSIPCITDHSTKCPILREEEPWL